MPPVAPRLLACCAVGAGVGLFFFAAESALVLRNSAIGFDVDVKGPFAALMEAVRPLVPPLLARIAAAYLVAGIAAGLLAGWVTRLARVRRTFAANALFLLNFAALIALVVWDRAIVRPALFDDLAWFRPVLALLVDRGEPWHPRAAAAAWLFAHCAAGVIRGAVRRTPLVESLRFVASAVAVLAVGTQLWANTLPTRALQPEAHEQGRPPRLILLVGIDAFRPDRLSAFGGRADVAPNLEALLQHSTVFTNAWTPIAQTEPAWRSLVSARWPPHTGVRYPLTAESRWLPVETFPTALGAAGWHTAFATDCSRFNYQTAGSGFSERLQPPRGAINFVLEKLRFRLLGTFADNALGAWALPELVENRALAGLYDPAGYAERLGERIADRAEAGPTVFAFHATAAHFPGDPTYPFHRRFVREDAPLELRTRMFFTPISAGGAVERKDWGRADAEALYDELLAQADAQLGVILQTLRDRGLYDDTAIIVFSDHGESFHEDHPELAAATPVHGARLWETENRILLAVKRPGGSPQRVDALVRLIDIGPTVLELAGVEALPGVDGVSLFPLLEGREMAPLRLYAETGFTHASPAAFDPDHAAHAPRTFDVYRVRRDGVVELTDEAHAAILAEKDHGAFDGQTWVIRAPKADGRTEEICRGACPAPDSLVRWLDALTGTRRAATVSVDPEAPRTTGRP